MQKTYSKEGILAQYLIAFGQGTGPLRVSQATATAFSQRYEPSISQEMVERWEEIGVQVLERVRAVGRAAALHTAQEYQTVVEPEAFLAAAQGVENASLCPFCPDLADERPAVQLKVAAG